MQGNVCNSLKNLNDNVFSSPTISKPCNKPIQIFLQNKHCQNMYHFLPFTYTALSSKILDEPSIGSLKMFLKTLESYKATERIEAKIRSLLQCLEDKQKADPENWVKYEMAKIKLLDKLNWKFACKHMNKSDPTIEIKRRYNIYLKKNCGTDYIQKLFNNIKYLKVTYSEQGEKRKVINTNLKKVALLYYRKFDTLEEPVINYLFNYKLPFLKKKSLIEESGEKLYSDPKSTSNRNQSLLSNNTFNEDHALYNQYLISSEKHSNCNELYDSVTQNVQVYRTNTQEMKYLKSPNCRARTKDAFKNGKTLLNGKKCIESQGIGTSMKLLRNFNNNKFIIFGNKHIKFKSSIFNNTSKNENIRFGSFKGFSIPVEWHRVLRSNINCKKMIQIFDSINDNKFIFVSLKPENSQINLELSAPIHAVFHACFFIGNQKLNISKKKTEKKLFYNKFKFIKQILESLHKNNRPSDFLKSTLSLLPILTQNKENNPIAIHVNIFSEIFTDSLTTVSAQVVYITTRATKNSSNDAISSQSKSNQSTLDEIILNETIANKVVPNLEGKPNLQYQMPGHSEIDFFIISSTSHVSVPTTSFEPTIGLSPEAYKIQQNIEKIIKEICCSKEVITYLKKALKNAAVVNIKDISNDLDLVKFQQLKDYFDLYVSHILFQSIRNNQHQDMFCFSRQIGRIHKPKFIFTEKNSQIIQSLLEKNLPLLAFLKEAIVEENLGRDLEIRTSSGSSLSSYQSNLNFFDFSSDLLGLHIALRKVLLMMRNDLRLLKKVAGHMYKTTVLDLLPKRPYTIKKRWKAIAEKISVLNPKYSSIYINELSAPVKLKFSIAKLKRSELIKKIIALYDSCSNILNIIIRLVRFPDFSSDLDISISSKSFSEPRSKESGIAQNLKNTNKHSLYKRCYSFSSFHLLDIERTNTDNSVSSNSESLSTEKTSRLLFRKNVLTKKFKKYNLVKKQEKAAANEKLARGLNLIRNHITKELGYLEGMKNSTISFSETMHPLICKLSEKKNSEIFNELSVKSKNVGCQKLKELPSKRMNIEYSQFKTGTDCKYENKQRNQHHGYYEIVNCREFWRLLLNTVKLRIADYTGNISYKNEYMRRLIFEIFVSIFVKIYFKLVKLPIEQHSSEDDSEDSSLELQELQQNTTQNPNRIVFTLDSDENSQTKFKKKKEVVEEVSGKPSKKPYFKKCLTFLTKHTFSNLRNIIQYKRSTKFRCDKLRLESILQSYYHSNDKNIMLPKIKENNTFSSHAKCLNTIISNQSDNLVYDELLIPKIYRKIGKNEDDNFIAFSNNHSLSLEELSKKEGLRYKFCLSECVNGFFFWKVMTILQLSQSVPLSAVVCFPEYTEILKEALGLANVLEYDKNNRVNLLIKFFYKRDLRFFKTIINMQAKAETFFRVLKTNLDSIGSDYSLVDYLPFKHFLEERLRKLYLILKTKESSVLTRLWKLGKKFVKWSTTEKIDLTRKVVHIFKLEFDLFELRAKLGKLAGMVNMKNVQDTVVCENWSIFCIKNMLKGDSSYNKKRSIKKYMFEKSLANALSILKLFLLEKYLYNDRMKESNSISIDNNAQNCQFYSTDIENQREANVCKYYSRLREKKHMKMAMRHAKLNLDSGNNTCPKSFMFRENSGIFNSLNVLESIVNLRPEAVKKFLSCLLKSLQNIRFLFNDVKFIQSNKFIKSEVSEASYSSEIMNIQNLKHDHLKKRIKKSLQLLKSDELSVLKCIVKKMARIFLKKELEGRLGKYLMEETKSKLSPLYLSLIDHELSTWFLNSPKYAKLFYGPYSEDQFGLLMGMMQQGPRNSGKYRNKGIVTKTSDVLLKTKKDKRNIKLVRNQNMSDVVSCKTSECSDLSISLSHINTTRNNLLETFPNEKELQEFVKLCATDTRVAVPNSFNSILIRRCKKNILKRNYRQAWLNTYQYKRKEGILCGSAKRAKKNHYFELLMKLFEPIELPEPKPILVKPELEFIPFQLEKRADAIQYTIRENIKNHITAPFSSSDSREAAQKSYKKFPPLLTHKSYHHGEIDTFKNIESSFYRWKRIVNTEEGYAYIRFLIVGDRSKQKFFLERLWTGLLNKIIPGRQQKSKKTVIPKNTGCWKDFVNMIMLCRVKNEINIPINFECWKEVKKIKILKDVVDYGIKAKFFKSKQTGIAFREVPLWPFNSKSVLRKRNVKEYPITVKRRLPEIVLRSVKAAIIDGHYSTKKFIWLTVPQYAPGTKLVCKYVAERSFICHHCLDALQPELYYSRDGCSICCRCYFSEVSKKNQKMFPRYNNKRLRSCFVYHTHNWINSHSKKSVNVFETLKNYRDTKKNEELFGRQSIDKSHIKKQISPAMDIDWMVFMKVVLGGKDNKDSMRKCYQHSWQKRSKMFMHRSEKIISSLRDSNKIVNEKSLFGCKGKCKDKMAETVAYLKDSSCLPLQLISLTWGGKQLFGSNKHIYDLRQDKFCNIKKLNTKLPGLVSLHEGKTYLITNSKKGDWSKKFEYKELLPKFTEPYKIGKLRMRKKRWYEERFNFYHWAFTVPIQSAVMEDFDRKVKEYLLKVELPLSPKENIFS